MSLVRQPRTARSETLVTAATSTWVTPNGFRASTISLASTARSKVGAILLPLILPVLLPPRYRSSPDPTTTPHRRSRLPRARSTTTGNPPHYNRIRSIQVHRTVPCVVPVGGDFDRDACPGPGRPSRPCPGELPVRNLARFASLIGLGGCAQHCEARRQRRHGALLPRGHRQRPGRLLRRLWRGARPVARMG